MARQLHFDLPPRVRLGEGDFFVSDANRAAWDLLLGELPWPQGKLALIGPEGAGKSHLARIWAARHGGHRFAAADLTALPDLPADAAVAVEDLQDLAAAAQEPLFHLHNRLSQGGGRLLLSARVPPGQWPIGLPDLASRVQGITLARIEEPDDLLLSALLAKLFADRQLVPARDVIPYLVSRMERSYPHARALVARLDAAALREGRDITRPLARLVMDKGR